MYRAAPLAWCSPSSLLFRAAMPGMQPRLAAVTFWGVADYRLGELIEVFRQRADAEAMLADVLRDEPSWAGQLDVVAVEFELCPN